MMKKFLFSFLALSMVFPAFMLALMANAAGEVCGMDGVTYDSAEAAEAAEVDVSYEFACTTVTDESNLYEAKSDVNFAGMLIEIGSTDIPTNIIVRDNESGHDYTINVTEDTVLGQRKDQATNLSDWIPGDQIRVIGQRNENTEDIESTSLINLSIVVRINRGANGWITDISTSTNEITYQWMNKEHTFRYDDNTRFVVGLKNPASADDLRVGDRIRARLLFREDEPPLAKIVIVLRRGSDLFMKIRTFTPIVTLVRLDSTIIPTTIQVRMDRTPGLRANDVNNLIGTEGALITVNITENTKIVRKYFGRTTLDEFSVGDKLRIVGRVNDDGTVDAKVVKNNSIWKTSTRGYAGTVTAVDTVGSYVMVSWTPIRHLTRKKLKQVLSESEELEAVAAQVLPEALDVVSGEANGEDVGADTKHAVKENDLSSKLRKRIKKIKTEQVGKFLRSVKRKKVKIDRIKHGGIKVGDLIKRLPAEAVRVDITRDTKIVVGTNSNASIADIQVGDKIRVRGTKHANLPIVVADTIVVVNALPEIEEAEDVEIDDINEVVSEIITDDTENAIIEESVSDTEEEITEDELGTEEDSASNGEASDAADDSSANGSSGETENESSDGSTDADETSTDEGSMDDTENEDASDRGNN